MRMSTVARRSVSVLTSIVMLSLTACGAGRSGTPLAPLPSPHASGKGKARVVVLIASEADRAAARAAEPAKSRTRMWVSPSSMGLEVQDGPHGSPPTDTEVFDISSGGPNCTATSPRSCTLYMNPPVGNDDFTITTYDQKPVGGTIPSTAKVLGETATVAQTITLDTLNTLNFYVGAVLAGVSYSGGLSYESLPANGSAQTMAMDLIPVDADGNVTQGGANDPYSNPISVTLGETGGSGHASLWLNGSNVGTAATIAHSSDSLVLHYDGGGLPGYYTSTSVSASGATGSTLQMSPMYVTAPCGQYCLGNLTYTSGIQSVGFTISEAAAPPSITYAADFSGCNVTTSGISGSGASASDTIESDDLQTAASNCTGTFSDSSGTSINIPTSIPAAVQHCSSGPAGAQIDANTVSTGSRCPLTVSTYHTWEYYPAGPGGAYSTSMPFSVSETNDTTPLSVSNTCSGDATVSPSSVPGGASLASTAAGTVTPTATTANAVCGITVSDGTQTQTIDVNTYAPNVLTNSLVTQPNCVAALSSSNGYLYDCTFHFITPYAVSASDPVGIERISNSIPAPIAYTILGNEYVGDCSDPTPKPPSYSNWTNVAFQSGAGIAAGQTSNSSLPLTGEITSLPGTAANGQICGYFEMSVRGPAATTFTLQYAIDQT